MAKATWQRFGGGVPTGGQRREAARPAFDTASGQAWLGLVPEGVRNLLRPQTDHRDDPDRAHKPGGMFLSGTFGNAAGTRPYRLYVPSRYAGQKVPLIVMLHGCMQSPEDFAAGTGMNAAAERQTCLVVYPGQPTTAHAQKCWKWFSAEDQERGRGEPSIIAGITRQVMHDYAVDPARVHVAGLSAGGAAAAIMGQAYPDLYASIGVHSGLACGAARDLPSALIAMQHGSGASRLRRPAAGPGRRTIPAIVFHGDRDNIVNPRNAEDVVAQLTQDTGLLVRGQSGQDAGGYPYRRTLYTDGAGSPVIEQWSLLGAGHAWSGGSQAGSFTDPRGPDATREMLRFFAEHPHPEPRPAA
jgi:poly(hydroxyalkanoate) depolymerase family esterase